jgi:hypothetical protein
MSEISEMNLNSLSIEEQIKYVNKCDTEIEQKAIKYNERRESRKLKIDESMNNAKNIAHQLTNEKDKKIALSMCDIMDSLNNMYTR